MTATRIRETADGVLYRLSEAVEYIDIDTDTVLPTHYVEVWYDDLFGGETMVYKSDATGCTDLQTHMIHGHPHRVDPDAMIEEMGYTVINGEKL